MSSLFYRPDMDEVRSRLTRWWNDGDIGRPAMQIWGPRPQQLELIPELPRPAGWTTDCAARELEYRANLSARAFMESQWLAEAVPAVAPNLGTNALAMYLGCPAVEGQDTVWVEPIIPDADAADLDSLFAYKEDNYCWQFTLQLAREQLRLARGRNLVSFADLVEGLDTLAAMRGTQNLLFDLVERPAWVRDCLRRITQVYYGYYDALYDMIRDEEGGSFFWCWAPGRMAKYQCDFSAMISPEMFRNFMGPVLHEMCGRVDYCIYHWDGPGALVHCDTLLSIPDLKCIQWTPGAGNTPPDDKQWWPYFHRILDAGKKIFIDVSGLEGLRAMRREFGPRLKQFMLCMGARDSRMLEEILRIVDC